MLFAALPAHADLYRWVDPESGSVRFSNSPPAWYESERGPKVERIPYRAPGAKATEADKPSAAASAIAFLEARWRETLRALADLAERGGDPAAVKRQLEAHEVLTTELERFDPGGRERRRAEQRGALQRLQK